MAINKFSGKYRFLSNFWDKDLVVYKRIVFPSSEHAFHVSKTIDPWEAMWVLQAPSPGEAKRRGRRITLRSDWDEIKLEVMADINWQKFQAPRLAQQLLDTGDQELVEGNTWGDTFWGVCNGVGENHLGKILMLVRDALRLQKEKTLALTGEDLYDIRIDSISAVNDAPFGEWQIVKDSDSN
jgi:ribA/ribD-fused uncharacterized protein